MRCLILDLAHKAFAEQRTFAPNRVLVRSLEARRRFWQRKGSKEISDGFARLDRDSSNYGFGRPRL